MNSVDSILKFLKGNDSPKQGEAPEGLCPNCWGREEYGGKFYKAVKNYTTDINSKNPGAGWIKDYADKHLHGIQLKDDDGEMACPKCKLNYLES